MNSYQFSTIWENSLNLNFMDHFRNIGVIGRMGSVKVVETLRQLKQYLLSQNYQVILEEDTAAMIPGHGLQVASKKLLGEICDLVIVVGGDGSLLGLRL